MRSLKNVRERRTDALTQVSWDQLEVMLAAYYRGQGFRVDHVGTGGTGARFDGGIDLKLYKDDAYIVVQCKHWNTKQVTHNAVHELFGVMVTQGATGAIVVTSGEFSDFAVESARKLGHVQLVNGDGLRGMLGPLPAQANAPTFVGLAQSPAMSGAMPQRRHSGGAFGHAMDAGLGIVLLKLVGGLFIVLSLTGLLKPVLRPFQKALGAGAVDTPPSAALPVPRKTPGTAVLEMTRPPANTMIKRRSAALPDSHSPTATERRESQRQADEAMRILETSTPEM